MLQRNIFFLLITLCSLSLYSYEIPKVDFSQSIKPTVVLFSVESIVVKNVSKYKLSWKTENATHVQITFLGNVGLSGSVTITKQEYQRGPITLTATSIENSFSDSKTINKFLESEKKAPLIIREESKNLNQQFYMSPVPYGRHLAPRRYRRY